MPFSFSMRAPGAAFDFDMADDVVEPPTPPDSTLDPDDPVAPGSLADIAVPGVALHLFIEIAGIATAFAEGALDDALLSSGRTGSIATVRRGGIRVGRSVLDLTRRRMVGGSLTVDLVETDDAELLALFKPRQRQTTYVTGSTTSGATTINVNGTSTLPSSGVVYIGGETITYSGKTGTSLTGCGRGAYGSRAQRHYGGTDNGAGVFTAPAGWKGRRVFLRGYLTAPDGSIEPSATPLGTFRLDMAPATDGRGVWTLACSELSDELAERQIGGGLYDQEIGDRSVATIQGEEIRIDVGAAHIDQWIEGEARTFALVTWEDDRRSLLRFFGVDGTEVILQQGDQLYPPGSDVVSLVEAQPRYGIPAVSRPKRVKSIRHVAVSDPGGTAAAIRSLLLSREGDGAEDDFDVLPGNNRASFGGVSWRFGAGVDPLEVDTAEFTALDGLAAWEWWIDQPTTVGDVLADLCLLTGTAWFYDRDGKLRFTRLTNAEAAPAMSLTSNDLVSREWPATAIDEGTITPRLTLECGYDPLEGAYRAKVNVIDYELADRYPEDTGTLELKSRTMMPIGTVLPASAQEWPRQKVTQVEAETTLRRLQLADKDGRLTVEVTTTLITTELSLGAIVRLTEDAPDYEGNAIVSARRARVIEIEPRYDAGVVRLKLHLLDQLFYVGASGIVSAYNAGTKTVTFSTGLGGVDGGGTAGASFVAGWTVRFWDVSAAAYEDLPVLSVSGDTLVLDVAPSFTPAAGIDYITLGDAAAALSANAGSNTAGLAMDDYAWQRTDGGDDPVRSEWG